MQVLQLMKRHCSVRQFEDRPVERDTLPFVPVCSFDAFRYGRVLDLPNHLEPIVLLPIGYPAESKVADCRAAERKPLEKLVRGKI